MPSAERSIVIAAPIAEVFAFFADAEHDPIWRTHVQEIKREGPLGDGAHYHQNLTGPGGRPISADFEVTAYLPDTHMAFEVVTGPTRPRGSYWFRTVDLGTEVTMRLSAELTGMDQVFKSRKLQKSLLMEVACLDIAKEYLESGQAKSGQAEA